MYILYFYRLSNLFYTFIDYLIYSPHLIKKVVDVKHVVPPCLIALSWFKALLRPEGAIWHVWEKWHIDKRKQDQCWGEPEI